MNSDMSNYEKDFSIKNVYIISIKCIHRTDFVYLVDNVMLDDC